MTLEEGLDRPFVHRLIEAQLERPDHVLAEIKVRGMEFPKRVVPPVLLSGCLAELEPSHVLSAERPRSAAAGRATRARGPLERQVGPLTRSSAATKKFLDGHSDVARDLPQKSWRDVSRSMKGHSCAAPIGVPKLAVGSALAYLHEPDPLKKRHDLARLENGDRARHSGDLDDLDTDEFGL